MELFGENPILSHLTLNEGHLEQYLISLLHIICHSLLSYSHASETGYTSDFYSYLTLLSWVPE